MKVVYKKLITICLLVLFIATFLSGCSNKNQNISTLQKIKQNKEFVVGMDNTFPPMEFTDDNNNTVGFDVDLANEIAKRLGAKLKIVAVDWSGIQSALKSKKFDAIISCVSITDERKKAFNLAGPYLYIRQVIAVKKGDTSIKSFEDLKGIKIGVQANTTGDSAVQKMKFINYEKDVTRYERITDAFNDLDIGRIKAVVIDSVVAYYYKKQNPEKFDIAPAELEKEPVGIALRKEDKDLYEEIQKILNQLKEDGTIAKISKKWFGEDITK